MSIESEPTHQINPANGPSVGFSLRRLVMADGPFLCQDGLLHKLAQLTTDDPDIEVRAPGVPSDHVFSMSYMRGRKVGELLRCDPGAVPDMSVEELCESIRQKHPAAASPITGLRIGSVISRFAHNGEGFVVLMPTDGSCGIIRADRRRVGHAVEDTLGLSMRSARTYPDCGIVVAHASPDGDRGLFQAIARVIADGLPTNLNLGPLCAYPAPQTKI